MHPSSDHERWEKAVYGLTLAHVRAAADFAIVLGTGGIYAPAQLEQAGRVPFGRVCDDFVEERLEAFRLRTVSVRP